MRGAIVGALMYERLARTPRQAEKLAASGKIAFSPCHHHRTVGPMAGIVSASMWVWVVRNETFGNLAFCTLNEGLGKVLRFGANSPDVIARLRWMERTLAPALKKALARRGPVKLKSLIAQALQMGDECHNRNAAATSLFLKELMPRLLSAGLPQPDVRAVVEFIAGNGHFFLNLALAASKATADTILGFAGSTLLAGMARNGVEIGIRIAGLGDRWFTAAAGIPKGLYFPGFSDADANPDLGDSTITETAGIGALAMACAPAIVQFVGGRPADAVATTMEMYGICAGEHPVFRIPYLDFRGTPVGVDVRKVADTGVTPVINTGIAHRDAGIGQVGAGLLRAPVELFAAAVEAFAQTQEGRRRGGDAWI
jgi:hypothetical protein